MKQCFVDEKERPTFLQIFDKINDFLHGSEHKNEQIPTEEMLRKQLQQLHGDGDGSYFDGDVTEDS